MRRRTHLVAFKLVTNPAQLWAVSQDSSLTVLPDNFGLLLVQLRQNPVTAADARTSQRVHLGAAFNILRSRLTGLPLQQEHGFETARIVKSQFLAEARPTGPMRVRCLVPRN